MGGGRPRASEPAADAMYEPAFDPEPAYEMEADFYFEYGGSAAYEPYSPDTYQQTQGQATGIGTDLQLRMVIRSADMSIQTLEYEDTVAEMERVILNRGGFIESSRQWMSNITVHDQSLLLWRGEFVLRVPSGLFDVVNRELVALGQVVNFSTASIDVTQEFHDLGSRLSIREEEERRVEYMREIATDLDEIIELEARLTQLRLTIDAYRRRREEIDQLATFATITLSLHEAVEIEESEEEEEEEEYYVPLPPEDGFLTSLGNAFGASVNFTARVLEVLAIAIATIVLPVGILAVVGFLGYLVVKKSRKRPSL